MAHKYSNFDDAFWEVWHEYGAAKNAVASAMSNAIAAYDGASDPVDKLHFGYATYAIQKCATAFYKLGDFSEDTWDESSLYESIYWAAQGAAPAEFTMDTLINTMLTADPMQVEYFVGLVDAYRMSIWNKPFNSEFFAALARGFETWE